MNGKQLSTLYILKIEDSIKKKELEEIAQSGNLHYKILKKPLNFDVLIAKVKNKDYLSDKEKLYIYVFTEKLNDTTRKIIPENYVLVCSQNDAYKFEFIKKVLNKKQELIEEKAGRTNDFLLRMREMKKQANYNKLREKSKNKSQIKDL